MGKKTNIALGAAGIIAGYAILVAASNITAKPTFVAGTLPTCDSEAARQLLQDAIEQSPLAKQTGLTIAAIQGHREFRPPGGGTVSTASKLSCEAEVFTNAGKLEAAYTIEFMNEAKDQVWLQVIYLG